jgi:hypothetical protein
VRSTFAIVLAILLEASASAAADQIVRRVPVPSPARPQGEVRLLRRDGEAVVQVVLWSRLLRRVGAEIRAKEERNWPDATSPAGAAARRYVAALEGAIEKTIAEAAPRAGRAAAKPPRKLGLVIELAGRAEASRAVFLAAEIASDEVGLVIRRTRERRRLSLPASYLERNLRLVVADAFGISEDEADRWIEAARSEQRSESSR